MIGMPKFRLDPFNDKALLNNPVIPTTASFASRDSGMAGAASRRGRSLHGSRDCGHCGWHLRGSWRTAARHALHA